MKKVLTKFIILETIILLIVLFLITKNYFSNKVTSLSSCGYFGSS